MGFPPRKSICHRGYSQVRRRQADSTFKRKRRVTRSQSKQIALANTTAGSRDPKVRETKARLHHVREFDPLLGCQIALQVLDRQTNLTLLQRALAYGHTGCAAQHLHGGRMPTVCVCFEPSGSVNSTCTSSPNSAAISASRSRCSCPSSPMAAILPSPSWF